MDIRKIGRQEGSMVPTQDPAPAVTTEDTAFNPQVTSELSEASTDISTIQEHLDFLKEKGVTEEHLRQVVDTLLVQGSVSWEFTLFGRIPGVFQMRAAWANDELFRRLDEHPPKTVAFFQHTVATHNLAASLISLGDRRFSGTMRDTFERGLEEVQSLPFPTINALTRELALFDRVILVATSDWGLENFTEPLPEE